MTDKKITHLKGFLIDDLKKLEETIKKVEDNKVFPIVLILFFEKIHI